MCNRVEIRFEYEGVDVSGKLMQASVRTAMSTFLAALSMSGIDVEVRLGDALAHFPSHLEKRNS